MCQPCEKNWFVVLIVCTSISLQLGCLGVLKIGGGLVEAEFQFAGVIISLLSFLTLLVLASVLACCRWNKDMGQLYLKVGSGVVTTLFIVAICGFFLNGVTAKSFCSEQAYCYMNECNNCVDSGSRCMHWNPPGDRNTHHCSVYKHHGLLDCGLMFYIEFDDTKQGGGDDGKFRGFKSAEDCVDSFDIMTGMWTFTLIFEAVLFINIVGALPTLVVAYQRKVGDNAIDESTLTIVQPQRIPISAVGQPVLLSKEANEPKVK